MEENKDRRAFWNLAGTAGLALGLTSTAFMFASQWLTAVEMPSFLSSIVSFIMWTAKFVGCIWLMRFFMQKFVSENPKADNTMTFRLGTAAALLSALVLAAASFANIAFISADMFAEQMEQSMQAMAPYMDSNSMEMMDNMMERMPQISFFSNLFYCFIYGTILSYILSRNIPSKNPFADYKPE